MIKKILDHIERFSWGGNVVAVHKVGKKVVVRELANPSGVNLMAGDGEESSARLTPAEAIELANLLKKVTQKSEAGGNS